MVEPPRFPIGELHKYHLVFDLYTLTPTFNCFLDKEAEEEGGVFPPALFMNFPLSTSLLRMRTSSFRFHDLNVYWL